MIEKSLYDGEMVFLGAFEREKDAIIEAAWSYDPHYAYYLSPEMRPMSPEEIKKRYDRLIERMEESEKNFIFAVKLIQENRLLGFLSIDRISWSHGSADLTLAVGDRRAMGEPILEALRLGLVYAFLELNLFRVTMCVPDFDPFSAEILEKAGFVREIKQREALYFNNRFWDLNFYAILKDDFMRGGNLHE